MSKIGGHKRNVERYWCLWPTQPSPLRAQQFALDLQLPQRTSPLPSQQLRALHPAHIYASVIHVAGQATTRGALSSPLNLQRSSSTMHLSLTMHCSSTSLHLLPSLCKHTRQSPIQQCSFAVVESWCSFPASSGCCWTVLCSAAP